MPARYQHILSLLFIVTFVFTGCKDEVRYTDIDPSPKFSKFILRATDMGDAGNIYGAMKYLDSVYRQEGDAGTVDWYHYYAFCFNIYNKRLNKPDVAMQYADSMMLMAQEDERRYGKMLAEANYAKGDALFSKGQYEEAYHYTYKAKTLVRNNLDSCGLSDYSYRLGMVLYKQKRFREAGENFRQAFDESDACPRIFLYFYRRQELLDNVGLCYNHTGEYDSALIYFNRALEYIDSEKRNYPDRNPAIYGTAKAVVYGNMGDAYINQGKNDTAEALFRKSIGINEQPLHDNIDAQYTRLKLARLYLDGNDIAAAGRTLDDIRRISDTLKDNNVTRRWYDLMWQYHEKKGEPAIAFNYLLNLKRANDSVNERTRQFTETDIYERFENMDKQYELGLLRKNNEIKENLLILGITVALLSTVILLLIYVNWKKSKENVKQLTELNNRVQAQYRELENLLAELEQSNKEKDRILRVVAHDIRNPISAIVALTQFLLSEHSNYSDEQKELLELINEACSNAMTLTKDILDAAAPRKNDETLEKEWVDINALLTNCVGLLRFKADEKKQSILLSLPEAPISLYVNKEKIWRVVNNLVINAIKFSNNGSAIEVKAARNEHDLTISITDSGIGIPEKYKNKVFDMFTEAKRLGTAGERSFGLGLSICRQIIEDHGGTIRFDSEENRGTTFYVTLPIDSITVLSTRLKSQLEHR